MRVSTKKTKIYKEASPLGIDLRGELARGHAKHTKNLLPTHGGLRKREGFTDVLQLRDDETELKINGIYSLKGQKIVHAGRYLYKCAQGFNSNEPFCSAERVKSAPLLDDTNLFGCVNDGKLWLVSGGVLYSFDGEVVERARPYVPLTRKRISCKEQGTSYEENESPSIITPKVKNSLIGTKTMGASYELSANMDTSKGFLLKCALDIALNSTGERAQFVGHTAPKRIVKEQMSAVHGVAEVNEIINIFEGRGTNYGINLVSEINVYLKTPVYVTSAVLTAKDGCAVPRMAFTLGAETIYDMGNASAYKAVDLTNTLTGKMIDGITLYGGVANAQIEDINIKGKHTYEGEVMLTYEQGSVSFGDAYYPTRVQTPLGEELTLYASINGSKHKSAGIEFYEGINGTNLKVRFDAPAYVSSIDNIEIEYSAKDFKEPYFTFGKGCKTDTGEQILALVRENGVLNLTSVERGFTYVPRALEIKLGADEEICALCQMQDFVIGAYKEKEAFYIGLNNGKGVLLGASSTFGCVNKNSAVTVNRDTLVLTELGVFGTAENGDFRETNRSNGINGMLLKKDLKNAFCVDYQGRLYIFFEDECYVCDTRYRHKEQNELGNGFEYEWFVLTDIPASYACVLDAKLYIGTKEGKIRTLSGTFFDTEYEKLQRGEFVFVNTDGKTELHIDNHLGIESGTEIVISNAKRCIFNVRFQVATGDYTEFTVLKDDIFKSDGTMRLFVGDSIIMHGGNGYFDAKIVSVDVKKLTVTVSVPCNQEYFRALTDLKGTVCVYKGQGDIYYKLIQNERELTLYETENAWPYLIKKKSVCAEYVSAPLSLDAAHESKSLHKIMLDLSPDTVGKIELGYETNKVNQTGAFAFGRALDFELFDFDLMAFGGLVSKTHTVRCFERAFAYVIIKISSSEPHELGIRGFSLEYSTNGTFSSDI